VGGLQPKDCLCVHRKIKLAGLTNRLEVSEGFSIPGLALIDPIFMNPDSIRCFYWKN